MKRVKLMSVALVALSMVTLTSVSAQPQQQQREPKSAEEVAKGMTDRMTKSLTLTEDQSDKIYAINLKHAEERLANVEKEKAERQAQKEERGDEPKEGMKREGAPRGGKAGAQQGGRPQQPKGREQFEANKKAMTAEIVAVLTPEQIVDFIEMNVKMAQRQPQQQHGRPGMQQGGRPGMQQRGPKMQGPQQRGPRPEGRPEGDRPEGCPKEKAPAGDK